MPRPVRPDKLIILTPNNGASVPIPSPQRADDALSRQIRRCAEGDVQALRAIYREQAGLLLGLASRVLRDRRLAEEAVQDAFVQIWRNAGRYEPSLGSPRAWMIGILRFRALDLRDAEGRRPASSMDVDEADRTGLIDGTPPPAFEDRQALRGCLGELDDGPRQSILLAYLDGLSHTEIAARLDRPLGTVKSWVLRGLASLRECLDR